MLSARSPCASFSYPYLNPTVILYSPWLIHSISKSTHGKILILLPSVVSWPVQCGTAKAYGAPVIICCIMPCASVRSKGLLFLQLIVINVDIVQPDTGSSCISVTTGIFAYLTIYLIPRLETKMIAGDKPVTVIISGCMDLLHLLRGRGLPWLDEPGPMVILQRRIKPSSLELIRGSSL